MSLCNDVTVSYATVEELEQEVREWRKLESKVACW